MNLLTLYVVTAVAALILGLIETAAYATGQFGRWPLWWGAANLVLGFGVLGIALQGVHPVPLGVTMSDLLLNTAPLLLLGGIRDFTGHRLPGWSVIAALAACAVVIGFDTPADFAIRIALVSLFFMLIDLAIIVEAVRLARCERLRSAWILAAVFLVSAAMYAGRSALLLAGVFGHDSLFGSGAPVHALFAVPATSIIVLRGMLMLLLAAERSKIRLEKLAYRDPLTGALNRAGLRHAKEAVLHAAGRPDTQASVLLIDVDHFKVVNDTIGHDAGDEVLRRVADAAHSVVPAHGLTARWGGDEFVMLLIGTPIDEAVQLAVKLQGVFASETYGNQRAGTTSRPTLSIGIAQGRLEVGSLAPLMKSADAALYDVKRSGRNAIGRYSDLQ